MKFVTFNIRYDNDQDGKNMFCFRKAGILKKINEEKPDIICFQEVLPHVAIWLKEEIGEYYVIGCPRSKKLESEQMAVAFRKEQYNLIKMDTFWLSETPYVPGSKYPHQSECSRTCTEAVFQDLKSQVVFRVINTHLDIIGSEVRMREVRQILETIEQEKFLPEVPVIVAGDFNARPDSPEVLMIEKYPGFMNAAKGIGTTFHGFGTDNRDCIDYIFIRGNIVCNKTEKWTDTENGVYLSDHYPVCTELFFTEISENKM